MSDSVHLEADARLAALRHEHPDDREFIDAVYDSLEEVVNLEPHLALCMVEVALDLSREIGYEAGESVGLLLMGAGHYVLQDNRKAFPLVLEAQPRIEELGDPRRSVQLLTILCGLHYTMGNHQKALEFGHAALAIPPSGLSTQWRGWPHYMLGDVYRATGDFERSRAHFQQVYDLFSEIGEIEGQARGLVGLATVCRALGDFEASEDFIVKALDLFEGIDEATGIARSLSELALVREDKGKLDEARALFERSLEVRRDRTVPLVVATCLIDLGRLLLKVDRVDEAIERLHEALEITTEEDHLPRMYAVHQALSDALCRKGDHEAALGHYREYQRIKEEVTSTDADTRLQNLEISLEASAAQKKAELVKRHNEELTRKNAELARLLQELRDTQDMLIQSEKMASLGQLTAGIAHEIKNPLNFVNNFSAMTKDLASELAEAIAEHRQDKVESVEEDVRELTDEIAANADRILEHGRRAGQIVNSMLVHSRQSGGKKSEVDVNDLVLTCVDLAYHGFTANNEGFEPAVDCDLAHDAGTFTVIEDEVARVLTNILNNAFYATCEYARTAGDGYAPQIRVETRRKDGLSEIKIADNGPGISDQHKKKVFEPFFTTKPAGAGTGLGLSQSYEIITERHGGVLKISDTEGGGATFVVAIPAG